MKWKRKDKYWQESACGRYRLNRDGDGLLLLWRVGPRGWSVGSGEIIFVSRDRNAIESEADNDLCKSL